MKNFFLSILSGIIFCLIFFVSYNRIPDYYYKDRDDAVITLSHARNLIQFGFIGVSPSGGRTEGYSSHFNFWLYTFVYSIFHLNWKTFFSIQTWITTFLLGVIIFRFFNKHKPKISILIIIIFSFFASTFYRFLEWHGSGMENAWMHVVFLYFVLLMSKSINKGKLYFSLILIGFLATLIRTEAIYHILPLFILYTFFYYKIYNDKKVFLIISGMLILWLSYNLWRLDYFGNFIPNTGIAQKISLFENLKRLVSLDFDYIKEYMKYALGIVYFHGIYLLIPVLFILSKFSLRTKIFRKGSGDNNDLKFILMVTLVLSTTSFMYPFIFGIARMDFTRTTTFIVLFVLLTLFFLYSLILENNSFNNKGKIIFTTLLLSVLLVDFSLAGRKPKIIGWDIEWYKNIITEVDKFAENNFIHRVNLANPDLGKISYEKKYNVFDLGMLGSPLISNLASDKELFKFYFYNFALPDFIAIHEFWSGSYSFMFFDNRFYNVYQPIFEKRTKYLDENFPDQPQIMEGYYVRKDLLKDNKSREWMFIQELKKKLSIETIKLELDKSINKNEITSHQYVVRSVFRFIPELKKLNLYADVLKLFDNSPSSILDKAILSSSDNGEWYKVCLKFLSTEYNKNKNIRTFFNQ